MGEQEGGGRAWDVAMAMGVAMGMAKMAVAVGANTARDREGDVGKACCYTRSRGEREAQRHAR